jgi:choline dehydrogenase
VAQATGNSCHQCDCSYRAFHPKHSFFAKVCFGTCIVVECMFNIISNFCQHLSYWSPNEQAISKQRGNYEYIVVGSGAGGGPLAARLALASKRTLLIEAGDDQGANINQQVPVFHAFSTEDESMAWDFFVNHYPNEKDAKLDPKMTWSTPDGKLYVGLNPPRGSKMKGILYYRAGTLGGCTAHNALVTIYPHVNHWAHIENTTGDIAWNAKNMRRLYQKLENVDYMAVGNPGH